MSRTVVIAAVAAGVLAGCAAPIRLHLDVPQSNAATATVRLVKGDEPPTPDTCTLPCEIAIAPDTSCDLSVAAPGFYPAQMRLDYAQMMPVVNDDGARLVIPLVARPTNGTVPTPTPSPTAAAAAAAVP